MRLHPQRAQKTAQSGFTLVEMIGVLAIISILASLLIPRVFQAIGDSRISNAASSCNSIKAAVNEYYGRYGLIAGPKGETLTFASGVYEDWDLNVLVAEGVAEKPFAVRIGNGKIGSAATGSRLRVLQIPSLVGTSPISIDNGAYNLDGLHGATTNSINDINGALLVEAVIEDVDGQDAKDFNDRIDGVSLGASIVSTNDWIGRVKYDAPNPSTGKTSVRVYLAHR